MSKYANTSIERRFKEILDLTDIKYKHQFDINNVLTCDFAIPSLKLIIECDGCYWHSCPKHHPKARTNNDKERDKYTSYYGWKTLRFWEHDINDNPEKCLNIMKKTILTRSRTLFKSSK